MFDLSKVLIPKPRQLTARNAATRIAQFGAPRCYLDVRGEDTLLSEGTALIRVRLGELACVQGEGSAYPITIPVDAA